MKSVAIVGAGVAGLSAAHVLRAQGLAVTLFDKGRNPGGRLASRLTAHGAFDHGLPLLDAQAPATCRWLEQLCQTGHLGQWGAATTRVGLPHNNQIARDAAQGLDLHLSHPVTAVRPHGGRWRVQGRGGEAAQFFDGMIVTVPQPQLAALLPEMVLPPLLDQIVYDPCWTLLWVPAASPLPATAMMRPEGHPAIAQVLREDLKPGREGSARYVVHANAEWSRAHLEQTPETVAEALQDAAAARLGIAPGAHFALAHRWRYAQVRQSLRRPQWRLAAGLHYASDGCLGRTVEDALTSGSMAAQSLLEHLNT